MGIRISDIPPTRQYLDLYYRSCIFVCTLFNPLTCQVPTQRVGVFERIRSDSECILTVVLGHFSPPPTGHHLHATFQTYAAISGKSVSINATSAFKSA